MGAVLSDEQVESYRRDGFLKVEGFVDRSRCDALRDAADAIVAAFEPNERRTVFTTSEQERVSDRDFMASGSGVWCFFEEEAFGPDGRLRQSKELSINKIGHAMHDLDPTFESFSYTPELAGVAADIGLADAVALQSMYIFKQPFIGGEVGCHQDAAFLFTDPLSVTGFWFAIEDATVENGCMWAAPGGHRTALRKVFARNLPYGDPRSDDAGTHFDVLDASPLPSPQDLVPIEAPAGTLVVLHGLLPHWSDVNRSSRSRHAFSLHCISAASEYPSWNWLQRPASLPVRSLRETAVAA
jgi:phytanoyl-CoA hydroxylase